MAILCKNEKQHTVNALYALKSDIDLPLIF